jgi:glycosyltransferase involved in cell wall biosynthesis
VLFVGAFPPAGRLIFGGMVTSCRGLLASSLPTRLQLDLLDSTQIANPPPPLAVRMPLALVRFVRFIYRLERKPPDAVLLFVAVGASVLEKGAMAWYARLRGVPALLFPRGGALVDACRASVIARTCTRMAFRGARKILCQSNTWEQFTVNLLGLARKNVAVIPNWTARQELLEIGAMRSRRRSTVVRLLFVGWLQREKGIFELLEVCRSLREGEGREFTLDIAGEGLASAEARALVERYRLNGIVRFQGWLSETDLARVLGESDVLVLPSWVEGLPNAMIEAMAAGLAVVVSRVGAVPDVIVDRVNGLLVEPRDIQTLGSALHEVIHDDALRERLGGEAHRTAGHDFGVEPAVERLVGEIENVVAGARAASRRRTERGPRDVS